jgi:hypothetical protein
MRAWWAGLGLGALVFLPVLYPRVQAQRGDSPHGDLAIDCGECHTPEGWTPLREPSAFDHAQTGFPLQAAHAGIACRSCHRSLVFHETGTACADCHADPHRGELGVRCEGCHSPRTWSNQREMFQAHSRTRFPLFGPHARVDCDACHREQRPFQYANTPTDCASCHGRDFEETRDPDHVAAGFSRRCEECHGVGSPDWRTSVFNHAAVFPLVGAHAGVACRSCHAAGFSGTSRECRSCHADDYQRAANPNHVTAGFPETCDQCHSESAWRPAAAVDHSRTRFPLTGAHQGVGCDRCHAGGRFAGTSTACLSCHEADRARAANPSHAGFPAACEGCHSTTAWRPAGFDHARSRFPLTGAHQRVDCARCHAGGRFAGTSAACVSCHEADRARAGNPSHAGFPTQCESCHGTAAWRPAS